MHYNPNSRSNRNTSSDISFFQSYSSVVLEAGDICIYTVYIEKRLAYMLLDTV